MLAIDHVIIGVDDPANAASTFRARFGLGALPGGRHPGGTGNWLIPLEPPSYLELLYVADRAVAERWAPALLDLDLRVNPLLAWAIRTDDIEAVGRRLNIDPIEGSVADPDGSLARWRIVADTSPQNVSRPFFIEYSDPGGSRPAEWRRRYRSVGHDVPVRDFAWVELGADDKAGIEAWLGDANVPVRFASGPPGLRAVALAGPPEIVVRSDGV